MSIENGTVHRRRTAARAACKASITGPAGIATGSRVITRRGEIPVENLVAGEEILTARGRFSHVRSVEFATPTQPGQAVPVAPIRVRRDAFGPMQPHHDVLLAAGQVVHTDDGPVAAASLLNGNTVVQDWATSPCMVRLEIDEKEPVLVEGMPIGAPL